MKRDDRIYLHHILDASAQIDDYTQEIELAEFMANKMVQDAVIRQREIIGEATKGLSDATRDQSSTVPWKDMAGMRDVLIHQYFGVDMGAVWETVKQDLPTVTADIKSLLAGLNSEQT